MNRSFYSSQRYQDFSKKHNRPSAFRVLIKKRNNQPVDQFETMET